MSGHPGNGKLRATQQLPGPIMKLHGVIPGWQPCALACLLLSLPLSAHAEMMVTSYYRAKAPHIAAHRTLPMGTWLIITNPRNGRSARVVIGSRGPFVRGRSLDISQAAAKQLGFGKSGVLRLKTRVVEKLCSDPRLSRRPCSTTRSASGTKE